jgi:unsaturated chondroitin disaccharide hydrolase
MTMDSLLSNYLPEQTSPINQSTRNFPTYTHGSQWKSLGSTGWDDWIAGFWSGIHWIAEDLGVVETADAIDLTKKITPAYQRNFNIGFRYQYSWIPAYEATGTSEYKRKAINAAQRMSQCFFPKLDLFCHSYRQNKLIASNHALMNIPLLLWASKHSPNRTKYLKLMKRFLEKSLKLFVKSDGSTRNRIIFDPQNYSIKTVNTLHGVTGGCWSRGLAWTVNGLVMGGIFFENDRFLDTARKMVRYHKDNSFSAIPPFDYALSTLKRPDLTDTSAASILASSMLLLGTINDDREAYDYGETILDRLFRSHWRDDTDDGLIGGGCFAYPKEEGVNEATVWGDFYTLEALYLKENKSLPPYLSWLTAGQSIRAQAS